jgi:uncharacterized membrane protein YdjX (TVP38/TMEM64 family)
MRFVLKTIAVVLGVLIILGTLGGNVEYRGLNHPLVNLLVGGALIFAPLAALAWFVVYVLYILPIAIGFVIGIVIGGNLIGKLGVVIGAIAGAAAGGALVCREGYSNALKRFRDLIAGEQG